MHCLLNSKVTSFILANNFESDGVIAASYANFGFIPYGQTIMGKIHFDQDNELGCDEYSMNDKLELERTADVTPFFIARRGECSFVQKVRNMENIGVSVGIVIDEFSENVKNILMSDDGTGGGIRIPSMLISRTDGDILMNWLTNASPSDLNQLVIMAEFVMPFEENNKVEYDFWFTSSSNRAIDFIEDFKPFQEGFEGKVDFTPHYVFWECIGCDQRYIESDCYGGGKYCAVEPSNDAIKGREIVLEDLRQKCLYNKLKSTNQEEMWFSYIQRVHQTCYATINEDCSFNAHKHLKLDFDETQKCVDDSFS